MGALILSLIQSLILSLGGGRDTEEVAIVQWDLVVLTGQGYFTEVLTSVEDHLVFIKTLVINICQGYITKVGGNLTTYGESENRKSATC